jgi:hypothetical protein
MLNISVFVTSFDMEAIAMGSDGSKIANQSVVIQIGQLFNFTLDLMQSRSGTVHIDTGETITLRLFAITTGVLVPFLVNFDDPESIPITYTLMDESVFINKAYSYAGNYTVIVTAIGYNQTIQLTFYVVGKLFFLIRTV